MSAGREGLSKIHVSLYCFLALGESQAGEETLLAGQEEGDHSTESREVVVSSSPQGCLYHSAGCPEIPLDQAPEEGRTGHH